MLYRCPCSKLATCVCQGVCGAAGVQTHRHSCILHPHSLLIPAATLPHTWSLVWMLCKPITTHMRPHAGRTTVSIPIIASTCCPSLSPCSLTLCPWFSYCTSSSPTFPPAHPFVNALSTSSPPGNHQPHLHLLPLPVPLQSDIWSLGCMLYMPLSTHPRSGHTYKHPHPLPLPAPLQSDIWSLGCVLYEMTCQKQAFDAPNMRALIQKVRRWA